MATRIEGRMTVITRSAVLAALVIAVVSGCSTPPGTATSTGHSVPAAVTDDLAVKVLSGWGAGFATPTTHLVTVPDDAQSVVVQFGCAGGHGFFVELGDSMMLGQSGISGMCDGLESLSLPIDGGSNTSMRVSLPEGVRWVAQTSFSREPFENDAQLTQDCEQFSRSYSALVNADEGFAQYGVLTAEEWQSRVDAAAEMLAEAAGSSSTMLGEILIDLQRIVTRGDREVGGALNGAEEAVTLVTTICGTNQTPVVISAEFGG